MSISQVKLRDNGPLVSEKIYEEMYSKADILYFSLNADRCIKACNVTAEEKLGQDKQQLLGKKFLDCIQEAERPRMNETLDQCYERGYIRDFFTRMITGIDCLEVCINGLAVSSGDSTAVKLYIRDIHPVVRLERQRRFYTRLLREFINRPFTESLLARFLDELKEVMEAEGIGLLLSDGKGKTIHQGEWPESDFNAFTHTHFSKIEETVFQDVLQTCRRYHIGEFSTSGSLTLCRSADSLSEFPQGKAKDFLFSLSHFGSLILAPVSHANMKGYCLLAKIRPDVWNERDIDFIEDMIGDFLHSVHSSGRQEGNWGEKAMTMMNVPILGLLVLKNGRIQRVNPWVERFLERPAKSLKNIEYMDLIHPEYRERILSMVKRAAAGDVESCDALVMGTNNRYKAIQCAYNKVGLNGDSIEIWYWVDKEDRRHLSSRLFQARKMETLGMLAGGIIHDFNNLLASILGYSSMMIEEIGNTDAHYEDIRQINRTTEKAVELTSRLMAHAHGQSFIVERLDVNMLIQEVAGILSRSVDKTITMRAELDPRVAAVRADAVKIQQCIMEVGLNARDAMPRGGKLIFKTANLFIDEIQARHQQDAKPGQYVQISISDTGIGMNASVKEQIFDPNFTTKDHTGLRGTGLSRVQEIVNEHHGFISVFSETQKGTVFKIHIPAQSAAEDKPKRDEKTPLKGKETILLVDDEKILRETARKMLSRYGYRVISAESGSEALSIYKKHLNKIDLVILDFIMPGLPVHRVLTWMKKINPKAKILAVTDMGDTESVRDSIETV
ncbi:MAG TPA: response regulator, partial [bacterium]|nr:response regulator [bacterium]